MKVFAALAGLLLATIVSAHASQAQTCPATHYECSPGACCPR